MHVAPINDVSVTHLAAERRLLLRGAGMLSTPVKPRWGPKRWVRLLFGRWLTVLILLFASPGTADVVQEAVSLATGIECCNGNADDCGQNDGHGCGHVCVHCTCCSHPRAAPWTGLTLPTPPRRVTADKHALGWYREGAYSPGYHAPPFRPPLA